MPPLAGIGESSGWFDDVALAAGLGLSPIIVAVCRDLHQSGELQTWLRSAIPAMVSMHIREVHAQDIPDALATVPDAPTAWIVTDAAEGSDTHLAAQWQTWNHAREILRAYLLSHSDRRQALIFLVTEPRMPLIGASALDLLSVAETMTVDEEPFAVGKQDKRLVEAYQRVLRELEQRHGCSTEELQNRLFDREPLPLSLSQVELNRWKAAAEALRKL